MEGKWNPTYCHSYLHGLNSYMTKVTIVTVCYSEKNILQAVLEDKDYGWAEKIEGECRRVRNNGEYAGQNCLFMPQPPKFHTLIIALFFMAFYDVFSD